MAFAFACMFKGCRRLIIVAWISSVVAEVPVAARYNIVITGLIGYNIWGIHQYVQIIVQQPLS